MSWEAPGEVEEYRIIQPLGAGAMGVVFLAHDTLLDRAVAIKFVSALEVTVRRVSRRASGFCPFRARRIARTGSGMTPCALTEADLPAATDLLARVGLSGASTMLRCYLRWQPDGVWKLELDGALAGTVTLLHQGSVGFVGCMAVHPARQGAGLGRRLLEHAQREARRAGITTFLLEAMPAGEPLYRRLGYVDEHESMIFTRDGVIAAAPPKIAAADPVDIIALDRRDRRLGHVDEHESMIFTRDGVIAAAPPKIAAADPVDIIALDRRATGRDRAVMIASLIEEFGGAVICGGGRLDGYAIVAGDRLGPVIASTAATGRALVERFAPTCAAAVAPLANTAAIAALVACGFTEARPLRRMRLGPPVAARPDWIWTLASPGAG